MIKLLMLCAGLALALPGNAQAPAPEGAGSAKASPQRRICERIEQTGSRITAYTVCKSAREWDAQRREQRDDVERVQRVVNQAPADAMSGATRPCCRR